MPISSSRSSRSSKCCLVCGSSDLALFCRKSNRTSVDACTAKSFTLPMLRSTATSSLDLTPSTSMTSDADDSIFGLISSATAPGPLSSRSSSMSLPRFAREGSRPRRAASSLTASPILSVSYPCGFSPSAMVVFPDPGIPVRHTISFGNMWDRQSRYIRACTQSWDVLHSVRIWQDQSLDHVDENVLRAHIRSWSTGRAGCAAKRATCLWARM